MLKMFNRGVRSVFRQFGYEIIKPIEFTSDYDEPTRALYRFVKSYTMTTKERVFALRRSVEYIVKHNIPGDIVECGVWKGGSMMAVARTLLELNAADRTLYLFDTFEGMSAPTDVDKNRWGKSAEAAMKVDECVKANSPLEEVREAMRTTGYNEKKIVFVKGKVEETLPFQAPENIALLRLDTDWYESTYHELTHLYPRLSVGGVLIIDDYGDWEGARKAVDQYIGERNLKVLLNRIDDTGRLCVKLEV